jgi:hypothetical protein
MATQKVFSISGYIQRLTDLEKKEIPLALARALQGAGGIAKRMIQAEINGKVDRPTPFTERAAFGSRVQIGETSVFFGLKNAQGDYMQSLYEGGERRLRPFETKFRTKFGTKYLIPHESFPDRDSYGNVPLEALKTIMKHAQAKTGGYYYTKKQIRFRPLKGGESKESVPIFNMIGKERGVQYIPMLSLEEPTQAAIDALPGLFSDFLQSGFEQSERSGRYRR